MNGVRVDYEASLKQTAKGVWYVDQIRTGDKSIDGLVGKLNIFMQELDHLLN